MSAKRVLHFCLYILTQAPEYLITVVQMWIRIILYIFLLCRCTVRAGKRSDCNFFFPPFSLDFFLLLLFCEKPRWFVCVLVFGFFVEFPRRAVPRAVVSIYCPGCRVFCCCMHSPDIIDVPRRRKIEVRASDWRPSSVGRKTVPRRRDAGRSRNKVIKHREKMHLNRWWRKLSWKILRT